MSDNLFSEDQINLYKSVFRGREDVFALHWKKGNKSGYMPAHHFDPYMYRLHKMKGGNFKDFPHKRYLPLSDLQINKHLRGEQLIGVYPLLQNNTSWFIAADFDKENWIEESRIFIQACEEKGIPTYLERSRSGNGGHIWIFFEQAYPAVKSRKIFTSILQSSGVFSLFDKNSSFDRLFPNQDLLSGKGLGNLIALPLHHPAWMKGNSCFVCKETLEPISNQWEYLKDIKRVPIPLLDSLFVDFNQPALINAGRPKALKTTQGQLNIRLANTLNLDRTHLPLLLINFLKEELNFQNTEFFIKKKLGKNTWGTKGYFRFIDETDKEIITPRGITGKVLRFCRSNSITYDFRDDRKKRNPISILFNAPLRDYQIPALAATSKKDLGIIVAPPGAGKTVIGLKIIAEKQQPALIIVHRKQLAEQWIERIQAFMGIPKKEIGKIGQGKCSVGKKVTIAMIQSLGKQLEKTKADNIQDAFGTIIVDECHHIPAETFHKTLTKLSTFYLYGLTATPFRKYSDGKLIFIHMGEVIAEISPADIPQQQTAKIIIRNTSLEVPFNSKTDKFETLSKVLIHDSSRNKLILQDVTNELNSGKRVVILTERKEHIDSLHQYLKQSYETITLSGNDTENSRNDKWKQLRTGNYQVLITTGQLFGEGADLQNASVLFLVYPFSFEGKLIQYIGRVQRSELTPTIYDYHDLKINYLHKLFLKRNAHYRKLQKQTSLLDEKEPEKEFNNHREFFTLEKKIVVPFEQLEFRYGAIAFQHEIVQMNTKLEFEIENAHVRPEFEILKPYFSKVLKRKNATIEIIAEFKRGKLISQLASSPELDYINREIVDSVKFRFIQKKFFGKGQLPSNQNLLALAHLQSGEQQEAQLFGSEEELLENLLRGKKVKHQKQLLYLAEKHESTILKIRFVINPFSFVFLLTGEEQYHLVMESLDTEEATYIWHIDKNRKNLEWNLKQIDKQLNVIRNKGRQTFLDSEPENFSRILHDYSDPKKGFFKWKDLLEERLV